MWTRRGFLGLGTIGAAACCLPRWATGAGSGMRNPRRLVVLQLMGGNDGLNTLVPFADESYARLRPNVALRAAEVLRLDPQQGLHPELKCLHNAYEQGLLAFVNGVGHELSNLSHFRSQAIWDAASTAAGASPDGWLGRHYECSLRGRQAGDSPIALLALGRDTLPLALQSQHATWPAIPALERWRAPALGLDPGDGAAAARSPGTAQVRDCLRAAARASELLARAAERRPAVEYPDRPLAHALKGVADVLAAELPATCFYLTYDGFDTHTRQREAHARQLARLDAALGAFLGDLRAQGRLEEVLLLAISEFGRRPAESGLGADAGTDHGTAGLVFLLGGNVRPGLHGQQPDLGALDADGNVRATLDFRKVYASVIDDWLGGDSRQVLGGEHAALELLRG